MSTSRPRSASLVTESTLSTEYSHYKYFLNIFFIKEINKYFSESLFPLCQVLISCGPMDGCHGGDAGVANKVLHHYSLGWSNLIYAMMKTENLRPFGMIKIA